MLNYIYIFASVIFVSALSLVGIFFLSFSETRMKKMIFFLVSLSAGVLIGDSFLHILPEASEAAGEGLGLWLWLIGGVIIFFVLEKLIHWRHCHVPTSHDHPHPIGMMNVVGDGLHNFFDGLIIAGSFMASPALGLATTIAVIAHEIPQEIGNFGVLVYAGYSRARALWLNLLSALTAILGAVVALIFSASAEVFPYIILPLTAGGFIYIALADLIPEMKKETAAGRSMWQLVYVIAGIGIMLVLKLALE